MLDLAKRMKQNYEGRQRFYLVRRMPVIIRVDGKAFHTLTRNCQKPFDEKFINAMQGAAQHTADEIQGCKLAFVQSDEASFLLTDYDGLQTEAWFDYNLCKIVSVAAGTMTGWFNLLFVDHADITPPVFDARAFNVPREEVANYFLWRAKDWHRNSVLMYAQSFFSHSQMQGKSIADLHEMLHGVGCNWTTDLLAHLRNGWWYCDGHWRSDVLPTYASINEIIKSCVTDEEDETLQTDGTI